MNLIDDVKTILRVEGHDEYLFVMVPALEEYVKEYCNNPFREIPGPVKIFIAKACEYNLNNSGLESRKMGTVSYSYNMDFPKHLKDLLRPYRRMKFHG